MATVNIHKSFVQATFVGHFEWPVSVSDKGEMNFLSFPNELKADLNLLHERQQAAIAHTAQDLNSTVHTQKHEVTFSEEDPNSPVTSYGVYMVLTTQVTFREEWPWGPTSTSS